MNLWKMVTPVKYLPLKNIHLSKKFTLKNIHRCKIFAPEKYSLLKIFTPEEYSPPKYIHSWKIFTPEKYSPLKNNHTWKIFTTEKYTLLKNIHCVSTMLVSTMLVSTMSISMSIMSLSTIFFCLCLCHHKKTANITFLILELPALINIAYIRSWKHFVSVFFCVCVSLSLYMFFCKSSSRSLSSPDNKLSENIWFVWSTTSYGGDKWRCHRADGWTTESNPHTLSSPLV